MVKLKNVVPVVTLLLIVFFFLGNTKAKNKDEWKLDPEYSANLTIMSTNYRAITGLEISNSVDIIKVFKNDSCDGDILNLSKIFSKELVFESKDKDFIERFMTSAQVEETHVEKCYQNKRCGNFYVVAFDGAHNRAGYFILYQCEITGRHIGIIRPFQQGDSSTIYYNNSLINLMKSEKIIDQ